MDRKFIDNLINDYFSENPQSYEPPCVRMINNQDEEPEGFFLVNRLLQLLVDKQIIKEEEIQTILAELHDSFRKRGKSDGF